MKALKNGRKAKQVVTAAVLSLTLLSGTFVPRESQAIVGAVTANPILMIVGAILAIPTFGIGIIILDSPVAPARFVALSSEQAKGLGMTDEELTSYSGELEEVNATVDAIKSEVAARGLRGSVTEVRTENGSGAQARDTVLNLWTDRMRESVSPATVSAVAKILSAQKNHN